MVYINQSSLTSMTYRIVKEYISHYYLGLTPKYETKADFKWNLVYGKVSKKNFMAALDEAAPEDWKNFGWPTHKHIKEEWYPEEQKLIRHTDWPSEKYYFEWRSILERSDWEHPILKKFLDEHKYSTNLLQTFST